MQSCDYAQKNEKWNGIKIKFKFPFPLTFERQISQSSSHISIASAVEQLESVDFLSYFTSFSSFFIRYSIHFNHGDVDEAISFYFISEALYVLHNGSSEESNVRQRLSVGKDCLPTHLILNRDCQQMPLQLNNIRLQQYGSNFLRIRHTNFIETTVGITYKSVESSELV